MSGLDILTEFSAYAGQLFAEELDAKILGIGFKRQGELDALNDWATSVSKEEYDD